MYNIQNTSYMIYRLYVICSYPGIIASKQPRGGLRLASIPVLLSKARALTTLYLGPTNIPVILGRQSQSLHRNTKKLSSIYATGNIERVGGKYEGCKLQGKALYARIRQTRMGKETWKESANEIDRK